MSWNQFRIISLIRYEISYSKFEIFSGKSVKTKLLPKVIIKWFNYWMTHGRMMHAVKCVKTHCKTIKLWPSNFLTQVLHKAVSGTLPFVYLHLLTTAGVMWYLLLILAYKQEIAFCYSIVYIFTSYPFFYSCYDRI